MRYKTLFRVLQKVVGLYFCVYGALMIPYGLLQVIETWLMGYQPSGYEIWFFAGRTLIPPIVYMGAGIYLFVGAKWIADLAIPGNRPYCHECGYELSGTSGDVCPECGTALQPSIKGYGTIEPPPRIVGQDE